MIHYGTTMLRCVFGACLVILIAGCAATEIPFPEQTQQSLQLADRKLESCRAALDTIQETISSQQRQDAGEQKVERFPYLRTDRMLATLANANLSDAQQQQLFALLEKRGRFAFQSEVRNLPPTSRQKLSDKLHEWFPDRGPEQIITLCTRYLAENELQAQPMADYVLSRLRVDDHYKTWQRIIGLYYLTLFPVLMGVDNWHDETLAIFDQPVSELPVAGELQRYTIEKSDQPLSQQQAAETLRSARSNPLQLPLPDDRQRQQLFSRYAPVFEIDMASNDDRIGTPYWPSPKAAIPDINIRQPVVYTRLSHVIFSGEVLLQLNYAIWFPARPCQGIFDILCGHIDGLIWRVTLANDGTPLLFDSIHSCGCYHQFFPTPALALKQNEDWLREPVLVPKKLPNINADKQVVVRLAHTSHYIEAVTIENKNAATALNTDIVPQQRYDTLRSITIDGNHNRSMFDASGLVPGTQRPERFILWPMGVPSPGAMRQWGTHATAFVGRRHFDEPCLIEELFTTEPEPVSQRSKHQFLANGIYPGVCRKKTTHSFSEETTE
jgi:hypothetical protein